MVFYKVHNFFNIKFYSIKKSYRHEYIRNNNFHKSWINKFFLNNNIIIKAEDITPW